MIGLDRETAQPLAGTDHISQSVVDILLTPVGSRVMRRDYGSYLSRLIDAPATPANTMRLLAVCAAALRRWEPRISIKRMLITAGDPADARKGRFRLDIQAVDADGNEFSTLVPL